MINRDAVSYSLIFGNDSGGVGIVGYRWLARVEVVGYFSFFM